MEEESSRLKPEARRAWSVAALLVVAAFGAGAGVAVTGCGGDSNDNNVGNAVSSAQGALSTAQQKIETATSQIQSVQSQVQSVQSQISTATSNSGGYGY